MASSPPGPALDELIRTAEHREWPEVVRAGLYSAVHRARIANDGTLPVR